MPIVELRKWIGPYSYSNQFSRRYRSKYCMRNGNKPIFFNLTFSQKMPCFRKIKNWKLPYGNVILLNHHKSCWNRHSSIPKSSYALSPWNRQKMQRSWSDNKYTQQLRKIDQANAKENFTIHGRGWFSISDRLMQIANSDWSILKTNQRLSVRWNFFGSLIRHE